MDTLPFDGAISRYLREDCPPHIRRLVTPESDDDIADPRFPYPSRMKGKDYDAQMEALQIQLVRMQHWVKRTGARVAIVFEGRDAAGKGGTIQRFTENLNPRGARVVALSKPTEAEAGQWYFQRYVREMPAAGEIVFLDRSWYNRGIVEHVFGWVKEGAREHWFRQVNPFEAMLVDDGIHLFKLWLDIHRATQLEQFLEREGDPLKQWKLSQVDIDGLSRWDDYTAAITRTVTATHTAAAPWTVLRGDDKRRTRINAICRVLSALPYDGKDAAAVGTPDPRIVGGPEMLSGVE